MRSSLSRIAVVIGLVLASDRAYATDKQTCVDASDEAQKLRDEGKLVRARERLLECGRESCPALVRGYCEQWFSDVDARVPTVVLSARDADGRDVTNARVALDGEILKGALEGAAFYVDPGRHVFTFETTLGMRTEYAAVIREGEKNRLISVVFEHERGVRSDPASPSRHDDAPTARTRGEDRSVDRRGGGIPFMSYVLGGVALVAFGSSAYFGVTGMNDLSDLRHTCAPNCSESAVGAARTRLIVADSSLLAGLLALGGAAILLFRSSSRTNSSAHNTGAR